MKKYFIHEVLVKDGVKMDFVDVRVGIHKTSYANL